MNVKDFNDLSKLFIETSFNLLFLKVPYLLSLQDVFIDNNNNNNEKPYTLNIVME